MHQLVRSVEETAELRGGRQMAFSVLNSPKYNQLIAFRKKITQAMFAGSIYLVAYRIIRCLNH